MKPAVFLDKDGTLVDDVPYNVDPARLRFTPHAATALRRLADAGYSIVVVSNQPGLAEGRFAAAEFGALIEALRARLRAASGVELLDARCCPHARGSGCACRKPMPGLLLDAARRHGLDLAESWMVGDILDDVEAGRSAGCRTVLLDRGGETQWRWTPGRVPDHRCAHLGEAADRIVAAAHVARRLVGVEAAP